jgi:hypothetical protein
MVKMDDYPTHAKNVVGRLIDYGQQSSNNNSMEAVIVFPERGKVQVINEVGARIWQLTDGDHSVREIIDRIHSEYEVESGKVQEDVLEFLNMMVRNGILILPDEKHNSQVSI